MSSTFQRLSLKDKPFSIFEAASEHQVAGLWNVVGDLDPCLDKNMRAKKDISKCKALKAFMEHCCQIRHYSFSIKKCGKDNCTLCLPPVLPLDVFNTLNFLPDPVPDPVNDQHYRAFESLYGVSTSECHRPSLKSAGKKSHDIPFSPSGQTAANVGEVIFCSECLRPHVLYLKATINCGY